MSTTMATDSALLKTHAAYQILEKAKNIGLPDPNQISIHGDRPIGIGVTNLADLTDWALWLEVPVRSSAVGRIGHNYKANGTAAGHSIEVFALVVDGAR